MKLFQNKFLICFLIFTVAIFSFSTQTVEAGGVVSAVIDVIVAVVVAVVVVVAAIVLAAVAPAAIIAQGLLAAGVGTTLVAAVVVGAVWVAGVLFYLDCVFGHSPTDPDILCFEEGRGPVGTRGELMVDVRVDGSDGPVSLQAPASFKVQWAISGGAGANCLATGSWSGEITASRGEAEILNAGVGNYNYGIDCYIPFDYTLVRPEELEELGDFHIPEASDNVVVNVIGPEVDLFGPLSISIPDPLTLSWTSSNVSSCSASGEWSGNKLFSGQEIIWSPTLTEHRGDRIFTLTCSDNFGNSAIDTHTVNIIQVPRCSFWADPSLITLPETSTLNWQCQYADSCSISYGIGDVNPVLGTKEVRPAETTNFLLTCQGLDGIEVLNATVSIEEPGLFDIEWREIIPR